MKRRPFIMKLAGLGAIGTMAPGWSEERQQLSTRMSSNTKKDIVAEWNHHLFSPDTARYPIHPKATYQPDLSQAPEDPLGDYLQYMDNIGIDKAVAVQPEPYGDDHSLIMDCLKMNPDRLKGTSLFYPKDPEATKKLAALVKRSPSIVATRFHAHHGKENYLDTFADPGVRALWKQAVELNLVIELHIGPNYAKQAGEAIKAFPGCKVLIDHFAEPQMGNPVEYAEVLELARFPNVYMKFSGLAHFAEDAPHFSSTLSFTSRVINAFGTDRMLMGGISPATVDVHMAGYSDADKAQVKGNNMVALLNWQ